MPKTFSDAINKIMPEVDSGSVEPLIIYRSNDGGWHCEFTQNQYGELFDWVEDVKTQDPFAVQFTGADFARGSFPYVYDKVFCARLRAEYNANSSGEVDTGEWSALINAVEDCIHAFSQKILNYFLEFDQPLREFYRLNTIPLYNRDNPVDDYDEERADEFIGMIEYKIDELTGFSEFGTALPSEPDKGVHIITSLLLNGIKIELIEDTENQFFVESSRGNDNLYKFGTGKYPEAIKTFTDQVLGYVYEATIDRNKNAVVSGVEYAKLTAGHCLPDSKNADFTERLVIVDASALLPEYRSSTSQLVQCSHGNGAKPGKNGRSVFGTELYSGTSVVYDRSDILGIADETKCPQWVKTKLPQKLKKLSLMEKLDENKQKAERGKTEHKDKFRKPGDREVD